MDKNEKKGFCVLRFQSTGLYAVTTKQANISASALNKNSDPVHIRRVRSHFYIEHLPEHTTLYVPLGQRACLKCWSTPRVLSSNAATSNDVRLCVSNYNHWENKCFTMISLYLNRNLIRTQCGCITASRCPQCVPFLWFYFGFSNMTPNLTNWAHG